MTGYWFKLICYSSSRELISAASYHNSMKNNSKQHGQHVYALNKKWSTLLFSWSSVMCVCCSLYSQKGRKWGQAISYRPEVEEAFQCLLGPHFTPCTQIKSLFTGVLAPRARYLEYLVSALIIMIFSLRVIGLSFSLLPFRISNTFVSYPFWLSQ